MMVPAAAALLTDVVEPTVSPAVVMMDVVAVPCRRPTTFGVLAPILTDSATLLLNTALTPAAGTWLMTVPIATVGLLALVGVDVKSALVSVVVATFNGRPTTFGTATLVT